MYNVPLVHWYCLKGIIYGIRADRLQKSDFSKSEVFLGSPTMDLAQPMVTIKYSLVEQKSRG